MTFGMQYGYFAIEIMGIYWTAETAISLDYQSDNYMHTLSFFYVSADYSSCRSSRD